MAIAINKVEVKSPQVAILIDSSQSKVSVQQISGSCGTREKDLFATFVELRRQVSLWI